MKTELKLLKYMKSGRIKKLKRYIEKYAIDIHSFRFKDGDYVIHKLCFYGLLPCIKSYFHSKNAFLVKNINGELPSHVAIRGGLQRLTEDFDCGRVFVNMEDLVGFLKEVCPESFKVTGRFGSTAEFMYRIYIEKAEERFSKNCHSVKDEDSEENLEDKYEGYYDDEDVDNADYFDSFSGTSHETWNDWANRMSKEYRQKQKVSSEYYHDPKSGDKTRPQSPPIPKISAEKIKAFEENMKKINEMHRHSNRIKYEKECEQFFKKHQQPAPNSISFKDIPWPHPQSGSTSDIESFLFSDMDRKSVEFKALVKKHQVMWHPDRFMNRCESSIYSKDRSKILKHVIEISQFFNALMSSL